MREDMTIYKKAILTGPRQLEIVESKLPELKENEVLVKVDTCCICTLEKRLYAGDLNIGYPITPGHEVSGTVAKTTSKNFEECDKVVLDLLHRCGECNFCRTGHSNHCVNKFKGSRGILGGFAEYIVVPSKEVFKINDDVSLETAALTEPLSDCIHSFMQSGLSPISRVLIIGSGTMGLLHLMILKKYGMNIFISDVDDKKLEVAKQLGATYLINPRNVDFKTAVMDITNSNGVNIVIVTAPGETPILQALDAVGVSGSIILYAASYPNIKTPIDINFIHYKEIKLIGSEGRTEKDFYKAVNFQNSNMLNLSPLISKRYSFANVTEALEASLDSSTYRVALKMGSY
jgi:2-desacetyl-2-hydroxyethyl bacteriochlorophyllide A dehydrogenase